MEGSSGSGSGSSHNRPAPELIEGITKPTAELERLQKEHDEKTHKIQELKTQIQATKRRLEEAKKKKKKHKDVSAPPDDRKEVSNNLINKYNSLKEEYNALLAERSKEQN